MAPAQQRILCVDNNASSNLAVYLLERVGYEVKTASSLADADRLAQVERFDLQLINHRLVDGLEIDSCEKLYEFAPRSPILFYSTVAYPYEQIQPIHCRQHHHTMAPVYVYDVVGHVSRLLQKKTRSVDQTRGQDTKTKMAVAR
ncbi:MAG TPA: response regulator [Pyrinomonadaceae bacterium]|jgi:DNA-binding NtrC family response regulator